MRLDPENPFDVYFALRLAFVDRPEVRIRTQDVASATGMRSRFAPDPTLWCVDAFVSFDKDDECTCAVDPATEPPCSPRCPRAYLIEDRLVQAGSLDRRLQEAGVGVQAVAAREIWEHGAAILGGRVEKRTGRRSFAAEVFAGDTRA